MYVWNLQYWALCDVLSPQTISHRYASSLSSAVANTQTTEEIRAWHLI